jgi:hypothetical protein
MQKTCFRKLSKCWLYLNIPKDNGIVIKESELGLKFEELTKIILITLVLK